MFPENIRRGVIGAWDSVLLTYLNKSWKLFETCLLTLLVLSTSNHVWLKTIFPEIRDIKILCSIYSKLILISSKILCVTGHEIVSGTRLAPSVKDVFSKQSQNTYQSMLAPSFPLLNLLCDCLFQNLLVRPSNPLCKVHFDALSHQIKVFFL